MANGFLVSRMKLPPFIVTLGTWNIIAAINYLYSANETIRSQPISKPQRRFWASLAQASSSAPPSSRSASSRLMVIYRCLPSGMSLNHTAWGRHVYAVGDDPEAAELSGING